MAAGLLVALVLFAVVLTKVAHLIELRSADRTIFDAAGDGNLEDVKTLRLFGADIAARDVVGLTPLHHAAGGGQAAMVRWLLAEGADVNAESFNHQQTPVEAAAFAGQSDTLATLRSLGGIYTLRAAVYLDDLAALRAMLEAEPNQLWENPDAAALLVHTVERGKVETLRVLLEYGADARSPFAQQAFESALALGHTEHLQTLWDYGVRLDPTTPAGQDAIARAEALGRHESVAAYLRWAQADD
jgi:ankyrin repeat protein